MSRSRLSSTTNIPGEGGADGAGGSPSRAGGGSRVSFSPILGSSGKQNLDGSRGSTVRGLRELGVSGILNASGPGCKLSPVPSVSSAEDVQYVGAEMLKSARNSAKMRGEGEVGEEGWMTMLSTSGKVRRIRKSPSFTENLL